MTDTFNQQLAHFPAGTDDLAAKVQRANDKSKLSDVTVAIYRLRKVPGITLQQQSLFLLDLADLYQLSDPEMAARLRLFYYNEFQHPEPETKAWLPSERELDDVLDMQRSEPRSEAWKRSGEQA